MGQVCGQKISAGSLCKLHLARKGVGAKTKSKTDLDISATIFSPRSVSKSGTVLQPKIEDIDSRNQGSDTVDAELNRLRTKERYLEDTIAKASVELERVRADIQLVLMEAEKAKIVKTKHRGSMPASTHAHKKPIPKKVRESVWRQYNGENFTAPCYTCGEKQIDVTESWHAGHVIPESKGGPTSIDNLRPICASCNLSMHDTDMRVFVKQHGLKGRAIVEFK